MSRPAATDPTIPVPSAAALGLAGLALTMLLSSLGTSIANVALPTLMRDLHASFQAVQWVVLAYLLAVTTLIVSVGRLGDVVGRRRLMLAGIGLFTAASIACGSASGLGMLVAARAAQGLGAAVMMTLTMALVGDAVPASRAGSAMGFLGTTSAIGTALGPSLGGLLIASFGWRSIFLVNLPLGVAALLLVYRCLPADRAATARPSFDLPGSALLVLTLAAYALSMTLGRGRFDATNGALLLVALGGAVLFVPVESRMRAPLVRPGLFRDRVLGTGFAMSSLVTTVAMTTLVVGPFYLSGALRLESAGVGLVMTAGPLVAAVAGVPAGRCVDRFGTHRTTIAGLAVMALGASALAFVSPSTGIVGYVVPLVSVTAGFAIFQAANNTAVMTGVDAGQRGVVSGLLNLSRNLGLITGASMMGAIFASASGTRDIATAGVAAVVSGTHAAFAVAALFVAVALLLAAGRKRRAPAPSPRS
ncbi:MFS transporter [Lysobacter yangpyeongensis]|uniref:MFS transporter n=1 Tax=Lysobacter yangpyeongensis TaxID=346182 RepID=A0ABW0SIF2_9GAMM